MFGHSKTRDNSKPEVSTGGIVRFVNPRYTKNFKALYCPQTALRVASFDICACRARRDDNASTSTFQASQNRFASSSEPAETMNPAAACESGSGKKGGLMHRLLAKVHKGEHHKSLGHSSHPQHEHQSQSEVLRKSPVNVRRVSIANESKENIPADTANAQASSQPHMVQDRSILSSSLPATPAESVLPSFSRRSSVADDHHLQAFEASAPGRVALAIAPELQEVKGICDRGSRPSIAWGPCCCRPHIACACHARASTMLIKPQLVQQHLTLHHCELCLILMDVHGMSLPEWLTCIVTYRVRASRCTGRGCADACAA